MAQTRWFSFNIRKKIQCSCWTPWKITKQFKKQKRETLLIFMGLKMLEETVIILLALDLSERILIQVVKRFLKGISWTYIAVTETYERSKKWKNFKEDILKNRVQLYVWKRRIIKFKNDIWLMKELKRRMEEEATFWRESTSTEEEIVGNS